MGRIMAQGINRLSARAVDAAKEPGLVADGGGLYLQVARSGAKSWIWKFMLNGRSREMGLGSLKAVSLAKAREKAEICRLTCYATPVSRTGKRHTGPLKGWRSADHFRCLASPVGGRSSGSPNPLSFLGSMGCTLPNLKPRAAAYG